MAPAKTKTKAEAQAETGAEPRGRGRPRPQEVIDRDESVLAVLTEPMTKGEIAVRTGLEPSAVYLSLWRLRSQEKVKRVDSSAEGRTSHTWVRV